ncbi:coiled-coil domain-containing protein 93 [Iris pallida]|uniref:Coiled-coil domain-containing protein 93 n=1 Tax=Iris pallida TaxID=29817 RepID=A0AAX6GFE6_IRIPA|nr:coiled-coil domain-containing protein 93 [Iris pallida]
MSGDEDQKERDVHDDDDDANCSEDAIQELVKRIQLLKALQEEESDLWSEHAGMQSELSKPENRISPGNESNCHIVDIDQSLIDSSNKLNSAKKELAAKLRVILSLKRQIDEVPAQTELIQYERRFSELYAQIQERHRQTRKQYATYNALMEIKELMLKEISLLNSIDSQFQDAMTSVAGRSKLVDSMDIIVKGTQQKLEKVQLNLLAEQKICDNMKEKHAIAIAEQRQFSSLLKAFQEECARNERLRRLTSM